MTLGPLGDSLYPGALRRRTKNESSAATSVLDASRSENHSRPESHAAPSLCPVAEGSQFGRGFQHEFRPLALGPSVAGPATDRSRPVQLRPLGSFHQWRRIAPLASRPPSCHAHFMTGHLLGVPVVDQLSARRVTRTCTATAHFRSARVRDESVLGSRFEMSLPWGAGPSDSRFRLRHRFRTTAVTWRVVRYRA